MRCGASGMHARTHLHEKAGIEPPFAGTFLKVQASLNHLSVACKRKAVAFSRSLVPFTARTHLQRTRRPWLLLS